MNAISTTLTLLISLCAIPCGCAFRTRPSVAWPELATLGYAFRTKRSDPEHGIAKHHIPHARQALEPVHSQGSLAEIIQGVKQSTRQLSNEHVAWIVVCLFIAIVVIVWAQVSYKSLRASRGRSEVVASKSSRDTVAAGTGGMESAASTDSEAYYTRAAPAVSWKNVVTNDPALMDALSGKQSVSASLGTGPAAPRPSKSQIEHALEEARQGVALLEAQLQRSASDAEDTDRGDADPHRSIWRSHTVEGDASPRFRVTTTMADVRAVTVARQDLLADIDEAHCRDEATAKMERLFLVYADGKGCLSGKGENDGFAMACRDMAKYVKKEWNARNARLVANGKFALPELSDAQVLEWVTSAVDVNEDGCITKDEALAGFKKVVDEIDPPVPAENDADVRCL